MVGTEKPIERHTSRAGTSTRRMHSDCAPARRRAPRASRRGVLLLVVLSVLVLFMLIGTAFLMTSSQTRDTARGSAKKDRFGNHATWLLDRALRQVLRDTENPASVVRFHSLLRDLYGTDGFQAAAYAFNSSPTADPVDLATTNETVRFAGASAADPLGPTRGQMVDIYFKSLSFNYAPNPPTSFNDPDTSFNEAQLIAPDSRHVLKLQRDYLGQPQIQTLPLTRGYYNGCLLTITSGPAAGQSARILEYDFVRQLTSNTRLYRLRVLAFPRADGQPLQVDSSRSPEISDLAGAAFLVNGRPFSGTGVGYNPLATTGSPRLSAMELLLTGSGRFSGLEIALTPNARYLNLEQLAAINPLVAIPPDQFILGGNVGNLGDNPPPAYVRLNDPAVALANRPKAWPVQSFDYGGAHEGYDAPDFQNMFLAVQTVTPRAQGRVVQDNGGTPTWYEIDAPEVYNAGNWVNVAQFLRLDLEDLPWPSFHRPDLVNFWFHRLLNSDWLKDAISDNNLRASVIIKPYDDNGQPRTSAQVAAQITAIKRRIMMRPLREDHPNFTGSNTASSNPRITLSQRTLVRDDTHIAVPYWEAVGPWDVDNDNDGVPDSIWVDLGDPVQEAEDGTRYKPLYAFLVVDLDGRLNVNAHGLADHINPANLALVQDTSRGNSIVSGPNLAGTAGTVMYSTDLLAQGTGYGPAEISLRPLFPIPTPAGPGGPFFETNRAESVGPVDDYATLLIGRIRADGTAVLGKLGFELPGLAAGNAVTPGVNYQYQTPLPGSVPPTGERAVPDLLAQLKFFNYPWAFDRYFGFAGTLPFVPASAFGMMPDLFGRYALGLDYAGQPVVEVANDRNRWNNNLPRPLLTDSPYELNLSGPQRRDSWAASFDTPLAAFNQSLLQNDDAAFATADLERVLRGHDPEAGALPSRLWDVVGAFDPLKLIQFDPYRVQNTARAMFNDPGINVNSANDRPEILTAAQQIAAVNRRLVTTDSVDLPVPSGGIPGYFSELGPDRAPGHFGVDDDPDGSGPLAADGTVDNPVEIGAPGSDDFKSIIERPLSQATLVDLLYYRVFLELRKRYILAQGWQEPLTGAQSAQMVAVVKPQVVALAGVNLAQSLLASDLIAGKRMDLNRPFGDGRDSGDLLDNNGNGQVDEPNEPGDPFMNGIVDDPLEAGEPFLDVNGNGKCDNGEPFIDLDRSGGYNLPVDRLWPGLTAEPITFDYTNGHAEPIHPAVVNAPDTPVEGGGVRNLESQARQLYARHLYCLMLLLVDEGYIAPWDEHDPQIAHFLDTSASGSQLAQNLLAALQALPNPPPNPQQEARRILLRKLTCRTIAQWAVNCADMRDSDAIMTPFEYDENPWDGWGCPVRDGNGNITSQVPLDGDAATDENLGAVIDWRAVVANNFTKQITTIDKFPPYALPLPLDQTRGLVWGAERPELLITETLAFHDRRTQDLNSDTTGQTAWQKNANPPEQDKDLDQRLRPRGSVFIELVNPWSEEGQRPTELYSRLSRDNPNAVGVIPSTGVELDRLSTLGVRRNGGGLTANIDPPLAANPTVRRSPVWRMIVVEENPRYRNNDAGSNWDRVDDQGDPNGTKVHDGDPPAHFQPGFFRPVDPDWFLFDQQLIKENEPYVERSIYFTSDNAMRYARNRSPGDPGGNDPYNPMTGKNSLFLLVNQRSDDADATNRNKVDDKLRIPPQIVKGSVPRSARYFIAPDIWSDPSVADDGNIPDLRLAPIQPGRCAVVGSAGAIYSGMPRKVGGNVVIDPPAKAFGEWLNAAGNLQREEVARFVTTISRAYADLDQSDESDLLTRQTLNSVRRIELRPSLPPVNPVDNRRNPLNPFYAPNPDVQQLLVARNGGTPIFPRAGGGVPNQLRRDNEVVKVIAAVAGNQPFRNVYDGNGDPSHYLESEVDHPIEPDPLLIPACVAVPVMNLSLSEPLDLYAARAKEIRKTERGNVGHYWNPEAAYGEGAYVRGQTSGDFNPGPYVNPFDLAPELVRTGTTVNYRTVYLQRLADPNLPWNPLPTLPDGTPNPEFDPTLPVNPYRTIDGSSVDLTAFNGASSRERDGNRLNQVDTPQLRTSTNHLAEFNDCYGLPARTVPNDKFAKFKHRLSFRSLERGSHDRDWTKEDAANAANSLWTSIHFSLVPRNVWRQEPPNRLVDEPTPDPTANPPLFRDNDMLEWNEAFPVSRADELKKRVNDMRIRDGYTLQKDIDEVATTADNAIADGAFASLPEGLKPPLVQDPSGIGDPYIKNRGNGQQFDIVLDHTLGFQNESFGGFSAQAELSALNRPKAAAGKPLADAGFARSTPVTNPATVINSTYPWLAWFNRPFISGPELLQVPAGSSSQMLRNFSTISSYMLGPPATQIPNPYDGRGVDAGNNPLAIGARLSQFLSPFGHLLNCLATSDLPALVLQPAAGDWIFTGAPHFYRVLDYVQVPSRFVGTDDLFNAEIFNDVPGAVDPPATGGDINSPLDPRYRFQPPFNKVSRQRDPGRVNLNTVTGRRIPENLNSNPPVPARLWSEVFDGIMQRYPFYDQTTQNRYAGDGNLYDTSGNPVRLGHVGPAWRDVVLSRRGYAQFNADYDPNDQAKSWPVDKSPTTRFPDAFTFGLNPNFPTVFSNPFRSASAADLVPLPQMLHYGVDASMLRGHHFNRGPGVWGAPGDDNRDGSVDDAREAGFGGDVLSFDQSLMPAGPTGTLIPTKGNFDRGVYPLFSETFNAPYIDGERNTYLYYQPMTRLGNLVTNRSNVFAIWITVGYFEVEKAPDWNDPDTTTREAIRARFGGTLNDGDAATIAALALYNRVYPDGYMLGKEVGSDTGDTRRQRGFYIVDRSEPVGFKPGEDVNVDHMIRVRRRIE